LCCFLAPLDALLLQCAPEVQALLLDRSIELGVASSIELELGSGEVLWKIVRDRGLLREIGWASRY
jgi:hypothetical protein